jgi:ketosteroid isomerase-like protein
MAGTSPTHVVETFLEALNKLDLAGMLAAVSDDFTLELPTAPAGVPKETTPKAAFEQVMGAVTGMWAEFSLTRSAVHPLADDPNRVIAEYASAGKNLDGSDYINTYLTMVSVRDGEITRWQEFFDPAPMVQAATAAAAAAAAAGQA